MPSFHSSFDRKKYESSLGEQTKLKFRSDASKNLNNSIKENFPSRSFNLTEKEDTLHKEVIKSIPKAIWKDYN